MKENFCPVKISVSTLISILHSRSHYEIVSLHSSFKASGRRLAIESYWVEEETLESVLCPDKLQIIQWTHTTFVRFIRVPTDCTFIVQITKGARGLGLSISGGVDSNTAFPGLIRIKRLFPHQAAWATGMQPGDIILEVNGQPLSGLTNYVCTEPWAPSVVLS